MPEANGLLLDEALIELLRASRCGTLACWEMKECVVGVGRCMSDAEAHVSRPVTGVDYRVRDIASLCSAIVSASRT